MRQLLDLGEAEKAAGSLDRVGGAEYLVHQLRIDVRPALFNRQQVGLDRGQVLTLFVDEFAQQFIVQCDVRIHVDSPIALFR